MRPARLQREGWWNVVVVGSGPSFEEEDAELVEEARVAGLCRVIAVNDNWRRLPHADLLFATDASWWKRYHEEIIAARFAGELWTNDLAISRELSLRQIDMRPREHGLARTDHYIPGGGNSGHMAVNLAYLFGAMNVILLGFDMQATYGRSHWFGEHPDGLWNLHPFAGWAKRFRALASEARAHFRMVNSSYETALDCVERETLRSELARLRQLDLPLAA